MVVQHNMQAANANRMLNVTTGQQAKSTEKLSSGYRINRAADDAAGLTISEKMRKQIKGLDRASTNAEDGVSSVQTAEGALTEVHSMLQRMNELATQASNGTNSESDRSAIQDEISQLTTEIDRVSETTKFNETYLLKGDKGTKTLNMEAHDAGLKGSMTVNGDGTATFTMEELNEGDSVSIGGKNYTIGSTVADVKNLVAAPNAGSSKIKIGDKTYTLKAGDTNVYDENGNQLYVKSPKGDTTTAFTTGAELTTESTHKDTAGTADVANNAVTVTNLKDYVSAGVKVTVGKTTQTAMVDTKNNTSGAAAADGIDDNDSTVISKTKAYQLAANELLAANQIGDTENNAKVGFGNVDTELDGTNGNGTFKIQLGQTKVSNTLSFNLHVGSDADMTNKIQVDIETMNSSYLGIKGLNVKDDSGIAATYAIDAIADAISKVSEQRSALGAVQNRLEHTISNVDNVVENTTSAESRIRDTDMASEMVNYSKNNILAQAGQSMLAQANQSNQGVLSLLQ